MANNGPRRAGVIFIGVADKEADATRAAAIDGIVPRPVGNRKVVGVAREAEVLNLSVEEYFHRVRDQIANSALSEPLKSNVLTELDYVDYFGLGVIVIPVPPQAGVSSLGDRIFRRNADQTEEVTGTQIVDVAQRFG